MVRKFFKNKVAPLKDLATIGIAEIGSRAISAAFWLYIVNLMEVNEYGLVNYYVGIASIAQIIAVFGTTNALMVYTSKGVKVQSTFFLISIVGGSICSVILFLIFQKAELMLLLMMFIIGDSVGGILLAKKDYSKYTWYNIVQKILLFGFGITFFHLFGFVGIIYGIGASYLLFVPIFCKLFKENKIRFDFSLLKERKNFIISDYLVHLVSGFRRDIDKLIIPILLGFVALGNYALSSQIYGLLMTFSVIFYKYILPHDVAGNENKKLKKLFILFTIVLTIIWILLSPLIISNLFTKYVESINIIQIMSLGIIPHTIAAIYFSKFSAQEKGKHNLITIIIQLSVLIIGFIILGSVYGIVGIAVSFVLSSTALMLSAVYLNRLTNIGSNEN